MSKGVRPAHNPKQCGGSSAIAMRRPTKKGALGFRPGRTASKLNPFEPMNSFSRGPSQPPTPRPRVATASAGNRNTSHRRGFGRQAGALVGDARRGSAPKAPRFYAGYAPPPNDPNGSPVARCWKTWTSPNRRVDLRVDPAHYSCFNPPGQVIHGARHGCQWKQHTRPSAHHGEPAEGAQERRRQRQNDERQQCWPRQWRDDGPSPEAVRGASSWWLDRSIGVWGTVGQTKAG